MTKRMRRKFGGGGYRISGGLHRRAGGQRTQPLFGDYGLSERLIHRQLYKRGKPQTELEIIGQTNETARRLSFPR